MKGILVISLSPHRPQREATRTGEERALTLVIVLPSVNTQWGFKGDDKGEALTKVCFAAALIGVCPFEHLSCD